MSLLLFDFQPLTSNIVEGAGSLGSSLDGAVPLRSWAGAKSAPKSLRLQQEVQR